jgi:hypothetical protein
MDAGFRRHDEGGGGAWARHDRGGRAVAKNAGAAVERLLMVCCAADVKEKEFLSAYASIYTNGLGAVDLSGACLAPGRGWDRPWRYVPPTSLLSCTNKSWGREEPPSPAWFGWTGRFRVTPLRYRPGRSGCDRGRRCRRRRGRVGWRRGLLRRRNGRAGRISPDRRCPRGTSGR